MKKLRIVLGAQLLFFGAWGAYLLTARSAGSEEFYLETAPVDPRDLLSGTYVALSYDISNPTAGDCGSLLQTGRDIYVNLEDRGKFFEAAQGRLPLREATGCLDEARPGWAKAAVAPGWGGNRAVYGIEKFFLNENDPRKDARSGSVLAKVKLGRDSRLMLLDLVVKTPPAR